MEQITITSNTELTREVNKAIKESGYKKSYIAAQMGITRQNVSKINFQYK